MIWGIEFIHISMCIYITPYLGYRDLLLIHTFDWTIAVNLLFSAATSVAWTA